MSTMYIYKAMNSQGKEVTGTITETNEELVAQQLKKQGLFPTSIRKAPKVSTVQTPQKPYKKDIAATETNSHSESPSTKCWSCKKDIPKESKFCPECGGNISAPIPWYVWLILIGIVLQLLGTLIKYGIL